MSTPVTTDLILSVLEGWVQNKEIHSPSEWVDAALKLTVLEGDEADQLYLLQQKVARLKFDYLSQSEKKNVSEAKAYIETLDDYREMRQLEAKIKRIQEFVRIAKVQARIRETEFKSY